MDSIEELLTRGVDKIYPSKEELEKELRRGKKLTLYQGFDPTGIQMHIGHMVGLMKLRQWQDLGHEVIFLIGDGTGQAGDPSGKTRAREKFLTNAELRKNATDYVLQAASIVRFDGDNPVKILYNGDWLNKLTLADILDIAGHFTLQQLVERDLFQERMKHNEPINLREFLYPLLQGYDSVAMKVDLELGGSDQTFNMLCGRSLVKDYLDKEKFVMTTPLLTDATGRKIGKTEGNAIGITDTPEELFGKIMSLDDSVIAKGLECLTTIPMHEVKQIQDALEHGEHPMGFKKRLAYDIIETLHNDQVAIEAQKHFEKTVQNKEMPSEIQTITLPSLMISTATIGTVLVYSGTATSISDAKRVAEQGGLTINGERISNVNLPFAPYLKDGHVTIKRGKLNIKNIVGEK